MRTTFNVQFFRKKNAEKKDGTAPIIARITVNGERVHFSTKQTICAKDWSVEQNKAKGRTAKSKAFNGILEEIKTSLHSTYHDINRKESIVTAEWIFRSKLTPSAIAFSGNVFGLSFRQMLTPSG